MNEQRRPNRLAKEKSPYLLKHAYNPVDWYIWGDEAFTKAKSEEKPIFLSIGYSSCHWCAVMERESFENEKIAKILNENFVPIKVDREERPDVDEVYMKAVTSLTGQGGWPLSVFLTPELKPFYGGTYFPPEPRHGLPGFLQLLEFASSLWREKRSEVEQNAEELTRVIRENYVVRPHDSISQRLLDDAYAGLVSSFDPEHGGYGGPPKFPLPTCIQFMLRYHLRTKKELALKSAVKTLRSMSLGGIHDHLGGGFHRYSTDGKWLIPHFEKMLYDNALLSVAYLEAYQLTRDDLFHQTARDILDWILREMAGREGGFYSAQDADTEDGEGFYYSWTTEEIVSRLGAKTGEMITHYFGVTPAGNFEEGRSILHVTTTTEDAASKFRLSQDEMSRMLNDSRQILLDARLKRKRPAVDDKILTSWNGLAISAFARAYQVLREERYLAAAERSASFILSNLYKQGILLRRYRDGETAIQGTLEDYSFLLQGLLDLYEASFEPSLLQRAVPLARQMVELFWDKQEGGFFLNSSSQELIVRVKEAYDGPTPSGNSVAALDLLRLWEMTGDEGLREMAETTIKLFGERLENEPTAHTFMLMAVDFLLGPRKEVVVVDSRIDRASPLIREIQSRFLPNKVVVLLSGNSTVAEISHLVEGKVMVDGKPTAYICENFACKNPINEVTVLRNELAQ
ncbi:MAG: thioredoxin domain-containing protein [Thaumarchaeota archaeon]|nr:thioredoxin domain-containing protein [Nitrososphaerota archaeon]